MSANKQRETQPASESKHAAVIGQPSMFNRVSLCKAAMPTKWISKTSSEGFLWITYRQYIKQISVKVKKKIDLQSIRTPPAHYRREVFTIHQILEKREKKIISNECEQGGKANQS